MGNKETKIDNQLIARHNDTVALSKIKILLFGCNVGKSYWFCETEKHKQINNITYKIQSFSIGDKLPDIDTIVYDTPSDAESFDKTLKYLSFIDGLILTYDIHNVNSLHYLKKCIPKIKETIPSKTSCLLLGMRESYDNEIIHIYVDVAQRFAANFNLIHTQIDLKMDIKAKEPFICLLRNIFNQKQTLGLIHNMEETKEESSEDNMFHLKSMKTRDRCIHSMNDDSQSLYEKYTLKFGKPEQAKYLISFAKRMGKTITFHDAKTVIEKNKNVLIIKNVEHKTDICQWEFERFFTETMGQKRSVKYLQKFKDREYADIRLIDPQIFDDEFFSKNEVGMDIIDKKLFKKHVTKYLKDCVEFEGLLNSLQLKEKYYLKFVNKGIGTLWSFYYHIHDMSDVERIVKNKKDSEIMWNKLDNKMYTQQLMTEGDTTHLTDINTCDLSDSEEMYTNGEEVMTPTKGDVQ